MRVEAERDGRQQCIVEARHADDRRCLAVPQRFENCRPRDVAREDD